MKKMNTHFLKLFCLLLGALFWTGTAFAQPANDLCAGAIPIVPSPAGTGCGTSTFAFPYNTDGTTDSNLPTVCSNPGLDNWFTWTATTTGLIYNDGDGAPGIAIFASCADAVAGNEIDCTGTFAGVDSELSGWNIGDNLIIQVYDFNGSSAAISFCLEEFTPPPPPTNDDCSTAIDLGTLTSPIMGTTVSATNDFVGDCLTNTGAPDIFYTILVPDGATLTIEQTVNNYDSEVRLAFGGGCPGTTVIACQDDPDTNPITWVNDTGMDQIVYYIQSAFSTGSGTFTLAWSINLPPANNTCATAAPLAVEEGDACTAQTVGTNAFASPSGETPDPSCGDFGAGQDIWYSVVVPMSGAVNVEISDAGGPADWAMSIYSGTCGALTEEACNDDTNALFPAITITGRTPGEVLLVRLFQSGNDESGDFNICAFSPAIFCDIAIDSEASTDESCLDAQDGTITLIATTSFGPVTFALVGPVSMTNTTGEFTGLPSGSYTYTATDDGFPATAGVCEVTGGPIVITGDEIAPVVTCPPAIEVTCDAIPMPANSLEEFTAQGGTILEACDIADIVATNVTNGDNCPSTGAQTISRVYIVTDNSGNVGTCEQIITVTNSLTGPVITSVPPNLTVDCAVNAIPQMSAFVAEADCSANITYSVSDASTTGTAGCNGSTIQFLYTATDDCGRITTHTQIYTISNEGPEFICPSDICVIECPADNDMIQSQFDDYATLASVISSCSENGITITNSFNPNSFISQNCGNPTVAIEGAVAFQTVTFRATDACGRQSTCTALVVLKDSDGPVISGTIPTGSADCADANQQAGYDNWIELALSNLSAVDGCSGSASSVSYAPLSPDTNCSGGIAITEVVFSSTDACGNVSFINANYSIIDNGAIPTAIVSGSLRTEENQPVELVEVAVDGSLISSTMMTTDNGAYEFALELNQNHSITPSRDDNHLNGITSYDLILMGQHLLEIQTLDSPYKLIAADVNHSGSITNLDLIQLRRLILHLDGQFTNNTSWRFVDGDYNFPNLENPFVTTFPEAVSINNLTQAELHNFVAVKVGDLNGSATTTLLAAEGDTRDRNDLVFQVEDQKLSTDQSYTIDFKAKDFNDILGYQFTLAFDPAQLEMMDFNSGAIELNAENFGDRAADGVLTTSWNVFNAISIADDETLFSITFKANATVNLSQAISINSSLTTAEAYNQDASAMNLGLAFNSTNLNSDEFALLQNRPNPFNNQTLIAFNLPEMTDGTLTIYDVAGRIIKQYKGDFNKGYNEITVNRADLSGAGLLYYQLETPTNVATMKMIVR